MLRTLTRLVAVACAFWASQALALGLGDIVVRSKLNQPFSATIPVLGASGAQLDALSVQLGGPDDFNRAGIERSDYLSTLKFVVEPAPGGARVVVSSDQVAHEPFLNFIVLAHSPDGKLLREYTVLLDPPSLSDNAAPLTTPAPASAPAYTPPAQAYVPPPAAPVQVPSSSSPSLAPAEAAELATQAPGARPAPAKAVKGKPAKAARPAAAPAPVAAAPAPAPVEAPAPAAAGAGAGATLASLASVFFFRFPGGVPWRQASTSALA